MYFASRVEAGQKLAEELAKYQDQQCAVIALSDGAVMVGAEIAQSLQCVLMLLLTEPIRVPGEPEPVAVINQDGGFTYNSLYSTGELEELDMDYHHFIEEDKLERLHQIHHLLGGRGLIEKDLLSNHTVILVSDGLSSGFSLDAAVDYLKMIKVKKIIGAVPVATIKAVDRMHILTDEIHCLSVIEDYITTDHYYEDNKIPPHEQILEMIERIVEAAEREKDGAAKKKAEPHVPYDVGAKGLLMVSHDDPADSRKSNKTAPKPKPVISRPVAVAVPARKPHRKPSETADGLLEISHDS